MRYNPKARLDRSQVQNRRGGGGGGFGLPGAGGGLGGLGGGGLRVGGGIGGVIVVIIVVLVSLMNGGGGSGPSGPSSSESFDNCTTGADANSNEDCALVADVNSIQAFWDSELPRQSGVAYKEADAAVFSGQTQTGCGNASADVGPFYCPVDATVYLDTSFFRDMLQGQLGAKGGPFSVAYVLAHEYGHHVQDLLGTMGKVRTQQGPKSDSVRLELQADCYAGIWTKHATEAPDDSGEPFILDLTQDDIASALDAARAVGDDRIQQRSGGRVNPEQWTHGSADQRMQWFTTGMQKGTLEACDTFAPNAL
jgi:predicted metalloprotease